MRSKFNIGQKIGFTLVELLIVIGVIAILASLAFVALNPLARFQDSRNTQRRTDVNAILGAIKLSQVDNGGQYIDDIEMLTADLYYQIGAGELCSVTCSNPTVILDDECIDLSALVDGGYLQEIPYDPNNTDAGSDHSYYYLSKLSTGGIIVGSCSEEIGSASSIPDISIKR